MFFRSSSYIFQYYKALEKEMNPDRSKGYALGWFYDWNEENSEGSSRNFPYCVSHMRDSALLGALLGDPDSSGMLKWNQHNITQEEVGLYSGLASVPKDGHLSKPNQSQRHAIMTAMNEPISFIQGPPGTGKTETILNLLSCIHHKLPEASVAVVSSNNQAIRNIDEKISAHCGDISERDPLLESIRGAYSSLGSMNRMDEFFERLPEGDPRREYFYKTGNKGVHYHCRLDYLKRYPIFSSTIHSMLKVFGRPLQSVQVETEGFDYVIVDECSQVNPVVGMVAMSRARHLVLLGDDQQLPPVIDEEACEKINQQEEFSDIDSFYQVRAERSFLQMCQEAKPFLDHNNRCFLNEHYRCHPEIIEFCNRTVYENKLRVMTPDDHKCPLYIRWYKGDYCEKWKMQEAGSSKTIIRNIRQQRIFMEEEWPELKRKLEQNPELSVCIIAPFRLPLETLKGCLIAKLQEKNGNGDDDSIEENRPGDVKKYQIEVAGMDVVDDGSKKLSQEDGALDIPTLTIHKAQGGGYDIVYYLSIEDSSYYTHWPWAQQRRLINVMVSRAKKELHVITSSQWLPNTFLKRRKLVPIPVRIPEEGLPEERENLFLVKLLNYMVTEMENRNALDHIRMSRQYSVFDTVPLYRMLDHKRGKKCGEFDDFSAPEQSFWHAFMKTDLSRNYQILHNVPIADLMEKTSWIERGKEENLDEKTALNLYNYGHFDFMIKKEQQICAIVEVDGKQHRSEEDHRKRDLCKDLIVKGNPELKTQYIRLPTDGSNKNYEMDQVRALLMQICRD